MRFTKFLPLIAFWLSVGFSVAGGAQVKSYREWKTEKVQMAQSKVTTLKTQVEARKSQRTTAAGVDPNLAKKSSTEAALPQNISTEKLEKQLRMEQYALEVAQDLSVTDYFVGYITKIKDKKAAFNEVAGKLTPEEVAELMTAYANSVFGTQASDLPVSATNVGKEAIK